MTRRSTLFVTLALAMLATRPSMLQTPAPVPAANQMNLGADPNGNPLRPALKTGHVSNYDESKVPPYTLPGAMRPSATTTSSPIAPTRGRKG